MIDDDVLHQTNHLLIVFLEWFSTSKHELMISYCREGRYPCYPYPVELFSTPSMPDASSIELIESQVVESYHFS